MPEIEYLDAEIANEGVSADLPPPNSPSWMSGTEAPEEFQPDIEPPHINDYAMLKKHKHYKQYFRPYRYVPFPAFVYHATQESKIVKTKEEFEALGPGWSPTPNKPRLDMTGKSLPVKSETQRLAEVVAQAMGKQQQAGPIDPNAIAAIVAAVVAATQPASPAKVKKAEVALEDLTSVLQEPETTPSIDEDTERKALIELAERDGVKIDKRWSNKRIKEALGI